MYLQCQTQNYILLRISVLGLFLNCSPNKFHKFQPRNSYTTYAYMKRVCDGIPLSVCGNWRKKWSCDDHRTYSFHRFVFVTRRFFLPQGYNRICKIDKVLLTKRTRYYKGYSHAPWVRVSLLRSCSFYLGTNFKCEVGWLCFYCSLSFVFSTNDDRSLLLWDLCDARNLASSDTSWSTIPSVRHRSSFDFLNSPAYLNKLRLCYLFWSLKLFILSNAWYKFQLCLPGYWCRVLISLFLSLSFPLD